LVDPIDWTASSSTLIGTVLVAIGLYRRDPAAQMRVRRIRGWIARKVLRRRPQTIVGTGAARASMTASGEGFVRVAAPDPSLPMPQRLERIEASIEGLWETLQQQARRRHDGDREVSAKLKAIAESLSGEIEGVRRLADEASAPERMEWFGVVFLILGSILSIIGS
jgi:hypothetical protein